MGSFVFTFVFPTLTIFLLVFHLFIACFMAMKYWCDKGDYILFPLPGLCRFGVTDGGDTGQLPGRLDLYQFNEANYNDAMIFYMFRHF